MAQECGPRASCDLLDKKVPASKSVIPTHISLQESGSQGGSRGFGKGREVGGGDQMDDGSLNEQRVVFF